MNLNLESLTARQVATIGIGALVLWSVVFAAVLSLALHLWPLKVTL